MLTSLELEDRLWCLSVDWAVVEIFSEMISDVFVVTEVFIYQQWSYIYVKFIKNLHDWCNFGREISVVFCSWSLWIKWCGLRRIELKRYRNILANILHRWDTWDFWDVFLGEFCLFALKTILKKLLRYSSDCLCVCVDLWLLWCWIVRNVSSWCYGQVLLVVWWNGRLLKAQSLQVKQTVRDHSDISTDDGFSV